MTESFSHTPAIVPTIYKREALEWHAKSDVCVGVNDLPNGRRQCRIEQYRAALRSGSVPRWYAFEVLKALGDNAGKRVVS